MVEPLKLATWAAPRLARPAGTPSWLARRGYPQLLLAVVAVVVALAAWATYQTFW
jgi:hypothetical protein